MLENTLAYDVIIIALELCRIFCMRYRRVLHCLLTLVLRVLLRLCSSEARGGFIFFEKNEKTLFKE